MFYVFAVLGLAFLMIVHESGHYLVARAFGMRVTRFSIGFGPAIYKKKPKGSDTTFQVALIPFLAYVQIDGMNPFEETDPNDKKSYANASLLGRIATIFAGSAANYVIASVLIFTSLIVWGKLEDWTTIDTMPDGAARAAGVMNGDVIVSIQGEAVKEWNQIPSLVKARGTSPVDIEVERGGQHHRFTITPRLDKESGRPLIGVQPAKRPVGLVEATKLALEAPPRIVAGVAYTLYRGITLKEKLRVSGPLGIADTMADEAKKGPADFLTLLGILSAYLAGFNLLPIPALDGGRLAFLAYEGITRQKPNQKVEQAIHAVFLLMFLTLIAVVTIFVDLQKN